MYMYLPVFWNSVVFGNKYLWIKLSSLYLSKTSRIISSVCSIRCFSTTSFFVFILRISSTAFLIGLNMWATFSSRSKNCGSSSSSKKSLHCSKHDLKSASGSFWLRVPKIEFWFVYPHRMSCKWNKRNYCILMRHIQFYNKANLFMSCVKGINALKNVIHLQQSICLPSSYTFFLKLCFTCILYCIQWSIGFCKKYHSYYCFNYPKFMDTSKCIKDWW